jgi:anti-sigma factor RsiW
MHAVVMENLEEYLAGELTPFTLRNIEAHLKTCGMCREELAQMREMSTWISSFKLEPTVVEPAPGFYSRVMRQVGGLKPVPTFASLFALDLAFGRRLAFSCLLTLAVLGGYLVSKETGEPAALSPEMVMAQQNAPSFDSPQAHEAMLATLTGFEQ